MSWGGMTMTTAMTMPERPRSLRHDDRGAVMLTGLFMAFVLVGALWYVIGVGDAIIFRDRMQEAADSGAYSSAALHAKGMNFIAACNIIMLIMVIAHIVLGIIQDVTILTCLAAGIGCLSCAGACFRIPDAIGRFHDWSGKVKDGLTFMHKTEMVIAVATPWVGTVRALSVGGEYGNQGRVGSVNVASMGASNIPGLAGVGLPVSPKPYSLLCEKAGHEIGELLFGWIPGVGRFLGTIGGNITGAALKLRYCNAVGHGGSHDPTMSAVQDRLADAQDELQTGRRQDEVDNARLEEGEQQVIPGLGGHGDPNQTVDSTTQGDTSDAREGWSSWFDPGFDAGWSDDGPLVVDGASSNGGVAFQVWSIAIDPKYLETNEKPVSTGANVKNRAWASDSNQGSTSMGYFSQAEFYYDCDAMWVNPECNGPGTFNAAFNLRWRARLKKLELPNMFMILARFALNPAHHLVEAGVHAALGHNPIGEALEHSAGGAVAIDAVAGTIDNLVVAPLMSELEGGLERFTHHLMPELEGSFH